MLLDMKIPAAKAAVDKELEKLEKISAWNLTKVKSKSEVIDEARTSGATVHFASLMDICHLKMPNCRQSTKNTKVELYSEATMRKIILDLMQYSLNKDLQHLKCQQLKSWISFPDCPVAMDKQQTQYRLIPKWKWKMLTNYWKFPNRNAQTFIWIRLPRHKWPKSWSSMEDPVVPLERNLYGHPLAGLLWERQFEKVLLKHGWEKIPNWECLFVHREKGLFLSVYVDDIKFGWKETKHQSDVEITQQRSRFGEPRSFLDHVYLGCTQRQCEISKDIVDNYRTMSESRISEGAIEKLPCSENLSISSWSYDMEGHAKKCVERYGYLANRTTQQLYKVSTPCLDDHHFTEEKLKSVGDLSKVCSQIVLKCCNLAHIGRPDIPWSVNKLAGSITKWTKACDKRISLFDLLHSSYMWIYTQCCYVDSIAKQCRLGLSRLRFCGRSWGLKFYFRWNIVHFRKSYISSDKLDVQ